MRAAILGLTKPALRENVTIPACAGSTGPGVHGGGHEGTIPACAGSTGASGSGLSRTRDHPRVRGEHAHLHFYLEWSRFSSTSRDLDISGTLLKFLDRARDPPHDRGLRPLTNADFRQLTPAEHTGAINAARHPLIQAVTGLVVIGGLVFTALGPGLPVPVFADHPAVCTGRGRNGHRVLRPGSPGTALSAAKRADSRRPTFVERVGDQSVCRGDQRQHSSPIRVWPRGASARSHSARCGYRAWRLRSGGWPFCSVAKRVASCSRWCAKPRRSAVRVRSRARIGDTAGHRQPARLGASSGAAHRTLGPTPASGPSAHPFWSRRDDHERTHTDRLRILLRILMLYLRSCRSCVLRV
mgnify:CR=1 FL=1